MGYLITTAAPDPQPPIFDRIDERREHQRRYEHEAQEARERGDEQRHREMLREADRAWSSDF